MAKKKMVGMILMATPPYPIFDNNPDGPSNLPDFSLDGTRYPKGKMSFVDAVAKGEAIDRPDVIVQTANGVSRSQGQNKGQQGNYSPDSSWAESADWEGANLSGM